MTSRRPYWCPKTMKRRPCWCPKPVLWELTSFLMQTLSFVPINLHRCWPREWKHSIFTAIFWTISFHWYNNSRVLMVHFFGLMTITCSSAWWPCILSQLARYPPLLLWVTLLNYLGTLSIDYDRFNVVCVAF